MKALLELLFPPSCIGCTRVLHEDTPFCSECALSVEPLGERVCRSCGEPDCEPGTLCLRCVREVPPFERAYAPCAHTGALARAIHRFKYEDHPELSDPLGAWLAEQARQVAFLPADAAVIPLPLHRQRLILRRYDQAELLARAFAKHAERPFRAGVLERVRATQRQVGLEEAERERNVEGAFTAQQRLEGRALVLIDDVFTTGATARAATRALLAAGAESVYVLTLARAWSGAA